ncbi:MAG: hypothetical protein J6U54_10525 [Clostridiales bacterium]|nr:hypothetical protein [Clostridiales bacterium]
MKGRYLSLILVVLMLFSLTSCTANGVTADDEVREFTSEVCDKIIDSDYSFINSHSMIAKEDDQDIEDVLDVYYDNPEWTKAQKKINDYILSTVSYEIDYNSAFCSHATGKGEITVYFKYVDFERLYKSGEASTEKEYYNLLKKYDTMTEKRVKLTYTYKRHKWYLDDYEKIFVDLFTWKDFHYDFVKNYAEYIKDSYWYHYDGGSGNTFSDTLYLEYVIETDNSKIDWAKDCYYVFYIDGVQAYTANITGDSYGFTNEYYAVYNGYLLNNSEPLDPGVYTVEIYDFQDNLLLSDSCEVVESSFTSGAGGKSKTYDFTFGSSKFTQYIDSAGWYELSSTYFDFDIWYSITSQDYEYYYVLLDVNDEEVYRSETFEFPVNKSYVELKFDAADNGMDDLSDIYTLEVYDGDDELILSQPMQ